MIEDRVVNHAPKFNGFLNIAGLALIAASTWYLYWRATETLNPQMYGFSLSLLIAEGVSLLGCFLSVINFWKPFFKAKFDSSLIDRDVAIFICTYGEPLDVVETTIFGALQVRGRKTVYVLDDGRREQMRQLAESYGVKYITRNDNKHAKAGNLNNALQHTNEEFVAVLDADFIPQPHFLEEAMGYFTDPKVAVVQFPQEFYNIDSTQHVRTKGVFKIWHEQRLFHEVIMPSRNSIGTAFWCGSPSVVRRSALNSIGGVLTGSITEDFETSLALQRKGYRTIFSNKIVAYGLSPHHIFGFRIQRARWGAGTVRNLFSSRSPLFSMNLNIFQKLSFFSGHHYYLSCYTRFYFLILPLLIHYFGQTQGEGMLTANPVKANFWKYLISNVLLFYGWKIYTSAKSEGRYSFLKTELVHSFNILTLPFELIRAILPFKLKFKVTPKSDKVTNFFSSKLFLLSGQGVVMFGTLYICFLSYRMLVNTVHSLADWNQDTLFIAGGIAFMLYQAGIMGYGIVHLIDHRFTRGIYRFAAILPIELIGEGGKCGVGLTYNITPHGYALMIPKSFGAKRGDLIKFRLRIPSGDIFGLLNVRWSKPIKSSNRPYDSFGVQVVQHENNLHYLAMMHFCYIFLARRYPSPENPIISNEISIQNDGGVYYMPKHDHRKIEVSTETNESLFEFAEESTDITIPTQNGNAA